jgi:alkylhydroperoxidase family enzyme
LAAVSASCSRWRPRRPTALTTRRRSTPPCSSSAVAALREHLSADEAHDAIAVVALLNLANRAALATGISSADDLD